MDGYNTPQHGMAIAAITSIPKPADICHPKKNRGGSWAVAAVVESCKSCTNSLRIRTCVSLSLSMYIHICLYVHMHIYHISVTVYIYIYIWFHMYTLNRKSFPCSAFCVHTTWSSQSTAIFRARRVFAFRWQDLRTPYLWENSVATVEPMDCYGSSHRELVEL